MGAHGIRKIIVASTLLEDSDAVVQSACVIAGITGAQLHMVHALDESEVSYSSARAVKLAILGAERALEAQAARVVPAVSVRTSWAAPLSPHRAIIMRAAHVGADLIVMGPHRGAKPVLGTTAQRVARRGIAPCLIVKRPLRLPLRRVVAAIDFSLCSELGLEEAARWCSAFGDADSNGESTELTSMHVIPPSNALAEYFAGIDEVGLLLEENVERAKRAAGHPERLNTRVAVRWSEAVDESIADFSADADLLVLGSRGKGVIRRSLLGSVAAAATLLAKCPVLLVPQASVRSPSEKRVAALGANA